MMAFPGSERCTLCNQLLTNASDHAALDRITDDPADPLHAHNQAHFHRTCLAVWPGLGSLIDQLEALKGAMAGGDEKIERAVASLVTLRSDAA
jgi:hypothetical protein